MRPKRKQQTTDQFQLDVRMRLAGIVDGDGSAERLRPPEQGFIRWVREGRGETLQAVAERMDVKAQSLAQTEKSEADGTIRIETLRRAAQALDCTVIYALVPNEMLKPRLTPEKLLKAAEELAQLARRTGAVGGAAESGIDPVILWEGEKKIS
jgi:predicted DNA-binding mobile mystery protein A